MQTGSRTDAGDNNRLFLKKIKYFVYVNVNIAALLCGHWLFATRFSQQALTLAGEKIDLIEHDFHIFTLLFQLRSPPFQLLTVNSSS